MTPPPPSSLPKFAALLASLIIAFILATGVIGGLHRAITHQPDWDDLQSESRYVWEHHHTAPGTAMFGYLPTTTFALWPFTTWLPGPLGPILFIATNLAALLATTWLIHRHWWPVLGATAVSAVRSGDETCRRVPRLAGARIPSRTSCSGNPFPRTSSLPNLLPFLLPLLLISANFQHALQSNQLTAWTLLLCVAGLTLVGRDRNFLGGLTVGLAALIKIMPGVLVIYLLLRRRWRALAGVLVATILFDLLPSVAFFGWQGAIAEHQAWLRRTSWHSNRVLIEQPLLRVHRHGTNASLAAVLTRWLRALPAATRQVILYGDPPPEIVAQYRANLAPDELLTLDPMPPRDAPWSEKRVDISWVPRFHIANLSPNTIWWLWATPLIAAFVALVWLTRRRGTSSADWPALSALWMLAMFWPSPMTRHYYLAWAFPAIVVVWATLLRTWNEPRLRHTIGTALSIAALAVWLIGVAALGWNLPRWYGLHLAVLALLTAASVSSCRRVPPDASSANGP
jgi:hypothetical protein